MRALFNHDSLADALQILARVALTRGLQPILAGVRIDVSADGTATARATNLDVAVEITLAVETAEQPGAIVVPLNRLAAIVGLHAEPLLIAVESDGGSVRVAGLGSDFLLPTWPAAKFPDFSAVDLGSAWTLPAAALARLIDRTVFCCDESATRYALGGVKFEADGDEGKLRAIATDGRRLAAATERADRIGDPYLPPGPSGCAVPAATLKAVRGWLARDPDGTVRLGFCRDRGLFGVALDGARLTSRVLEGRFPAWRDVLPDGPADILAFDDPGPLEQALAKAAVATDATSVAVTIEAGSSARRGAGLLCYASAACVGKAESWLGHAVDPDRNWRLDLIHKYVAQGLRALAGHPFTVEVRGSKSAVVFRSATLDYVVMPITDGRESSRRLAGVDVFPEPAEPAGVAS